MSRAHSTSITSAIGSAVVASHVQRGAFGLGSLIRQYGTGCLRYGDDPDKLKVAMCAAQEERTAELTQLREGMTTYDAQIAKQEARLRGLIDEFSETHSPKMKALIRERCAETEAALETLASERVQLVEKLRRISLPLDTIDGLADVLEAIREELDLADDDLKCGLVEDLGLSGTIAIEHGEHVLYLEWAGKPIEKVRVMEAISGSSLSWQA
jgi:hypothetical protein